MERLGHSSIQVTLDRYGHLFPSLDESLTEGLEATYQASVAAQSGAMTSREGRDRGPLFGEAGVSASDVR